MRDTRTGTPPYPGNPATTVHLRTHLPAARTLAAATPSPTLTLPTPTLPTLSPYSPLRPAPWRDAGAEALPLAGVFASGERREGRLVLVSCRRMGPASILVATSGRLGRACVCVCDG